MALLQKVKQFPLAVRQRRYRARAAGRIKGLHHEDLLVELAGVASHGYGLTVWQWLGRGTDYVSGHSPTSMHDWTYPDGTGMAFDAYAPLRGDGSGADEAAYALMDEYAQWVRAHCPPWLDEGIHWPHNPKYPPFSIKYGRSVPPAFWGQETWAEHKNHVHIGNS